VEVNKDYRSFKVGENIEFFNELVIDVFNELYSSFPVPIQPLCLDDLMKYQSIKNINALYDEDRVIHFFNSSIKWLGDNGFITYSSNSGDCFSLVVLTSKGLGLLSSPMKNLTTSNKTLGASIQEAVKSGSKKAVSDMISFAIAGLVK